MTIATQSPGRTMTNEKEKRMIKISYDKEGDVFEIRFSEKPISDSEYVEESGLVLDYDKDNNIIAVEIISFSKRVSKEELAETVAI